MGKVSELQSKILTNEIFMHVWTTVEGDIVPINSA